MTHSEESASLGPDSNEDLEAVFGVEPEQPILLARKKRDFKPWHHPVKQLVRKRQWADLTARLLGDLHPRPAVLRYFTMPGPDLLDVRVLAEVTAQRNVPVEFFGFDSTAGSDLGEGASRSDESTAATARAALRQAGRITGDSVILRGRLEDIVLETTHAANQLRRQQPFHVVNIDACSHLTGRHAGQPNLFDALKALMEHQLRANFQWLLFVTTRCAPDLLFDAGEEFKARIADNLILSPEQFGSSLATVVEADLSDLEAALAATWQARDTCFSKLYCVGLGKFLLHLFNGQPGFPADVELVSVYAYDIHPGEPKMLAVAFRVTPVRQPMFPPSIGGSVTVPLRDLEPERAIRMAERANRMWLLDEALHEATVREEALEGTIALLRSAGYDVDAWQDWLRSHQARPVEATDATT